LHSFPCIQVKTAPHPFSFVISYQPFRLGPSRSSQLIRGSPPTRRILFPVGFLFHASFKFFKPASASLPPPKPLRTRLFLERHPFPPSDLLRIDLRGTSPFRFLSVFIIPFPSPPFGFFLLLQRLFSMVSRTGFPLTRTRLSFPSARIIPFFLNFYVSVRILSLLVCVSPTAPPLLTRLSDNLCFFCYSPVVCPPSPCSSTSRWVPRSLFPLSHFFFLSRL